MHLLNTIYYLFIIIIIIDLFLFTCMEAETGPQLFTFEAC